MTKRIQAIQQATGREYWRSLDELAEDAEFRSFLEAEFPSQAMDGMDAFTRRRFLKVMAASFALAGWSGCWTRDREGKIVPYVQPQDGLTPGEPLRFSTTITRGGAGIGVVATSRTGRPIKIEGNPQHPASLGATDVFSQAEILSFYDPDRSASVHGPVGVQSWDELLRATRQRIHEHAGAKGRGIRILTGRTTSPSLLSQLEALLDAMPSARWHVHEPLDGVHERRGMALASGREADLVFDFSKASRIISLGCNFLSGLPGSVRYARDFADRRAVIAKNHAQADMNRLYVAEPTPTITGVKADHHLRCTPRMLDALCVSLAAELGVVTASKGRAGDLPAEMQTFAAHAAADLQKHRGEALVLVGESMPPEAHALAAAMNAQLDGWGNTVHAIAPQCRAGRHEPQSLDALVEDMSSGAVETLLIIDTNPVYTAPRDLAFERKLANVEFTVHLGIWRDETARACRWHGPMAHELESWGDARACDGTISLMQPLIAPLHAGRTPQELLAGLQGRVPADGRSLLQEHWRPIVGEDRFANWWRDTLKTGILEDSAARRLPVKIGPDVAQQAAATLNRSQPATAGNLELLLQPSPTLYDGRYANNAWLQELPDPVTKLTWGNAAQISEAAAKSLGVKTGDVVSIKAGEASLEAPVLVQPGQAENVVTLELGYGRSKAAGHVAAYVGADAYILRTTAHPWRRDNVEVARTGRTTRLANTQNHHAMEGRELLREGTLAAFRKNPRSVAHPPGTDIPLTTLMPDRNYTGQQWGMSIDLTRCVGCAACTIACQAENNIPVVGREQVRAGREMHWIRLDRYYTGARDNPGIRHQPVPCMHCENAPCEVVCPTGATQHSHDGLNEMVYNRCVGTRYCSNNCPYKVRRFNFLRYSDYDSDLMKLQRNPEVTVRARGVMEKCTYCVQRIRQAEIGSRIDDEPIPDGGVVTACQQVCPAHAIVFGDIHDPTTAVSRAKSQPHDYKMLEELNVEPRTTYLAEIRNPNPALEKERTEHREGNASAGA